MGTTPNAALRNAIFLSGKTQQEIADKAGVHETRMSKIVRGWVQPTDDEKKAIAKALRASIDELFTQAVAS